MTIRPSRYLVVLFSLLFLGLVACDTGDATPVQDINAPILSGDNMPKVLVTVWFSPTPEGGDSTPIPITPTPTLTPEPPEATITPTPYVGVFVGTEVDGTPVDVVPTVFEVQPGGVPGGGVAGGGTPASGSCTIAVDTQFTTAYSGNANVAQQLGCPRAAGQSITLVYQAFERGKMFWRDTRQIYALQSDGRLLVIADGWQEGMPVDDPGYAPPGGLLQPVRGFGLAWRSNEALRNAIGWANQSETPVPGFWQDFESGAMFVGDGGFVYAIFISVGTYSGPL